PFADSKRAVIKPGDDELRKLLKERYNTACTQLRALRQLVDAGRLTVNALIDIDQPLVASALELADSPEKKQQVLEDYVELTKLMEQIIEAKFLAGALGWYDYQSFRGHRLDAEIQLARFKRNLKQGKPD